MSALVCVMLVLLLDVAVVWGITLKEKEPALKIIYSLLVFFIPFFGIVLYYVLASLKKRQVLKKRTTKQETTDRLKDGWGNKLLSDKERAMQARIHLMRQLKEQFKKTELGHYLDLLDCNKELENEVIPNEKKKEIYKTVTELFSEVITALKNECPKLNPEDLALCVFTYLGYSVKLISKCSNLTEGTLLTKKSRMKDKLPAEWYGFFFPSQKRRKRLQVL